MWRELWRFFFHLSNRFLEWPWCLHMWLACRRRFAQCIEAYSPDLVVSLHPMCQHLPLQILESQQRQGGQAKRPERVPFATVCTDLGSAHRAWFHRRVDACFVASDPLRRIALRRGIARHKIRQSGLLARH